MYMYSLSCIQVAHLFTFQYNAQHKMAKKKDALSGIKLGWEGREG